MGLRILETECKIEENKATIVIEADSPADYQSREAMSMASRQAVKLGLAQPGHSSQSGPYPVNAQGQTNEDVVIGKEPVAAYRQDYILLSSR